MDIYIFHKKLLYIKGQISPYIVIMDDFNTPLSAIDKSDDRSQQRNFIVKLHYPSNELNRHLKNNPPNYYGITIFPTAHGAFSKIDYILSQK
jgi:hypothetical protein